MKRIAYLDTFCPEHSGRFWLKAFQKYGEVQAHEVGRLTNVRHVLNAIKAFQPTHIHFGSSTQSEKTFKFADVKELKRTGAKITFFYGDGYYRPYYLELAEIADKIYVTNINLCQKPNMHFTMCPAPKEMSTDYKTSPSKYGLVFIGNNYNPIRRKCINAINKFYPLTVFGKGWKKRKLDARGPVSYEDYPKVCQSSKIVMGDPAGPICYYSGRRCGAGNPDGLHVPGYCRAYKCSMYTQLRRYVSNRISNILMSGGVCLTPYVGGMERMFGPSAFGQGVENGKYLWWYKDWKEFEVLVKKLMTEDMSHVREAGRKFMLENYTFEALVERILYDDWIDSASEKAHC